MDEKWRKEAHQKMIKMAEAIAEGMGGKCELEVRKGYPYLINNEALTLRAKRNAQEFLGASKVIDLPIRMTAEDFAYFSQEIPACFYRLGTGNKARGITSNVHTDTFDVDAVSYTHLTLPTILLV